MPQEQKFEVPQELRHLAEENVERARQLYIQFMDGVGQAFATWSSARQPCFAKRSLVRAVGLEPTRRCHRGILSPLRLPVPPRPHLQEAAGI